MAGVYTWPIETEVGFYNTLYVGRRSPAPSEDQTPPGVVYEGCFSRTNRTSFNGDSHELPSKGGGGMTAKVGNPGYSLRPA